MRHSIHPAMASPHFFRIPQSFMQIHAREQTPIGSGLYAGGGLYAQGGRGILDERFSINDIKNTGRELFGRGVHHMGHTVEPAARGILDEKFSINDIKHLGKKMFGGSILDERFSVNDVIRTGRELFGRGFSKKQLNDIIHHKNKVIADLEETAYDPPSKGGRLKKGSAEAKAFMASIRKKKMRGGRIPGPPSRSPITDPSLL